jgi:hypothetical protein
MVENIIEEAVLGTAAKSARAEPMSNFARLPGLSPQKAVQVSYFAIFTPCCAGHSPARSEPGSFLVLVTKVDCRVTEGPI